MIRSSTLAVALAKRGRAGFTLIEILIAVVVVGLVLTAITSALTNSVKNSAESRYRTRAATLGQEAMETMAREKSLLGWAEFRAVFPTATDRPYCLQTLPAAGQLRNVSAGNCGASQTINEAGVSFTRQALVTKTSNNAAEVTVTIVVRWVDGNRNPEVTLVRIFRKTDQY